MIFSAADDWLAKTGINTTYSVMSACVNTTSCEIWPKDGSEGSADPELTETGSSGRERTIDVTIAIIYCFSCLKNFITFSNIKQIIYTPEI